MNRKTLLSLIIIDVLLLVLAIGLIFYRYQVLVMSPPPSVTGQAGRAAGPAAMSETTPEEDELAAGDADPAASRKKRNIAFTFRHSQAKRVEIIGDFNEWIPQSLSKSAGHLWSIALSIAPGEYAYNFIVDGKPVRDPNNPKVIDAGRGFSNSYLKVKPLEP